MTFEYFSKIFQKIKFYIRTNFNSIWHLSIILKSFKKIKFYIRTDFNSIWHLSNVLKPFGKKKFNFHQKPNKNIWYFTWRPVYITTISRLILLRMINISDSSCRENQNTKFIFTNFFLQKSCRLRDNVGKTMRRRTWHRRQYNAAHVHGMLDK